MAENQQNQGSNSQSTIKLYYRKSMTRRQPTDKNYKTFTSGTYTIINKNFNDIKNIVIRNYRKLSN